VLHASEIPQSFKVLQVPPYVRRLERPDCPKGAVRGVAAVARGPPPWRPPRDRLWGAARDVRGDGALGGCYVANSVAGADDEFEGRGR
jgi:hypothetical protein